MEIRNEIQQEFLERCQTNPKYSLRAFAKSLDVDHSILSRFIRGERNISDPIKEKIRNKIGNRSPNQFILDRNMFEMISEWYFDAICELKKCYNEADNVEVDPKLIAKRLKISISQAQIALEKINQYNENSLSTSTISQIEYTDAAAAKYQKQILTKALQAIDLVDISKRSQTSVVLAMDENDMAELKELIKQFRHKMIKKIEAKNTPNSVYALSVSLFPLTLEKS